MCIRDRYYTSTTNTRYTTTTADPNARHTTNDRSTGTAPVSHGATDQHAYSTDESGDRSYQEKLAEGANSGAMSGSTADPNRNVNPMP